VVSLRLAGGVGENASGWWHWVWADDTIGNLRAIWERLPSSLGLYGLAMIISCGFGIPLGIWWGGMRWKSAAALVYLEVAMLISIPAFWLATLSIRHVADLMQLPILLPDVKRAVAESSDWTTRALVWLWYLLFPATAISFAGAGKVACELRDALSAAMEDSSMRVLASRGIKGSRRFHHYVAVAAGDVYTGLVRRLLPLLMGLSIVVEYAFYYPGVGTLACSAMKEGKIDLLLVLALVLGLAVVMFGFLLDCLQAAARRIMEGS
jgi:ABC-type dipeptide/oligopeptide/nickel transport system permease component